MEEVSEAPYTVVGRVCLAYEDYIRNKNGGGWARVDIPKDGSKTYASCLKIWDWCGKNQIKLMLYFRMANEAYDPAWIRKTFRRDYAPFTIAVSEKGLLRVQAAWKKPVREPGDAHLAKLRAILSHYDPQVRKLMLEGAEWIDPMAREMLLRELL